MQRITSSIALCVVFASLSAASVFAEKWKPVDGKLLSRFAKDVDPAQPLPQYPRPQMTREAWMNLNGLWDYAIIARDVENVREFNDRILVPYPVESSLSGVGRKVGAGKRLWYKRNFRIPETAAWRDKRVLLHFGAVDWEAVVRVNDREVGRHLGGYSPFCFDITETLRPGDEQELVIVVWDPTDDGYQPLGKQVDEPKTIWYTSVTGIWQTVWLEPVPETSLEHFKLTPDIEKSSLSVEPFVANVGQNDEIRLEVFHRSKKISEARSFLRLAKNVSLSIPEAKLWTPDMPNLYDLKITLLRDGRELDSVDSYFAMRKISLGKCEKGITRMLLNDKFVFQHGLLDQGWWPDGLYTAPTDEALAYDVQVAKRLGYNMLRKHVKIEPARFYYHCDRLGLLVWQDMPNGDRTSHIRSYQPDPVRPAQVTRGFEKELKEMIDSLYNAPSIVVWVPFNEGWGQYDTCRIIQWTKDLDPTRLVDGPSGWTDRGCGDMIDKHIYLGGPDMFPPEENRATVLGEYGGIGMAVKGHLWRENDKKNWGYGDLISDKEKLFDSYRRLALFLHPLIDRGLSAAVYTQTTDVERETSGLMTYDRAVVKVDVEKFKALNDSLHGPAPRYELTAILPVAAEKEADWAYTTEKPTNAWSNANYNDKNWKRAKGPFGKTLRPFIGMNTAWDSDEIWIRRTFELTERDLEHPERFLVKLYHHYNASVFINGKVVLRVQRYNTDYTCHPLMNVGETLRVGKNVLGVYCQKSGDEQYIDAGLYRAVRLEKD